MAEAEGLAEYAQLPTVGLQAEAELRRPLVFRYSTQITNTKLRHTVLYATPLTSLVVRTNS